MSRFGLNKSRALIIAANAGIPQGFGLKANSNLVQVIN
jgi:hypothetical protein